MMEIDGAMYLNAEKWGVPKVACQGRSSKHIVCSSLLGWRACLPAPSLSRVLCLSFILFWQRLDLGGLALITKEWST